jgi:anion transporter
VSDLVVSSPAAAAPPIPWTRRAGAAAGPLVAAALWSAPLPATPPAQHALAIAVGTMVAWAVAPLEHAWTGVIALALLWASGTADATTIVSGYWNNTTGFLLGALLVGACVSQTGLARRIAFAIVSRIGSSYSGLLLALIAVDFVLTFVIPSGIARVAVLAAIVAGLIDSMGVSRRDPVARGMMIAVTCSATVFDKMVLAGTSSILASGIIEQLGGTRISYGRWFLAYVPCDVLSIIGCWRLILWLFPDRNGHFAGQTLGLRSAFEALPTMSARERRSAILAAIAIALWMTDVVHDMRPATIALAVGFAGLMPGLGVLRLDALRTLPYRTLVFTASALSLSAVLDRTGALELITASMVGWMRASVTGPASAAFVLYWAAFGYHLLLGAQNLMVAATLPAVVTLGQSLGHSPVVIGMIWIFGTAGKIFPYQSGVLMVGYSYGYFDGRDLIKVGLLLAVLESAILLLLVPLYWPLIGLR